ncbi:hypothetical protein J7M22_04835 [Candidatus Poribacteria bacterium]|nr:hypothetical protein [Candidatus Poribacteria bacterium]
MSVSSSGSIFIFVVLLSAYDPYDRVHCGKYQFYYRRPGNYAIYFEPGWVSGDLEWFFSDVNKERLPARGGGFFEAIYDFDLTPKDLKDFYRIR